MDAIALSKKNQKKIQKVVAKGQKKALKANKQAKKLVHQLPGKAEKAYKSYTPKDVQKIVTRVVAGKAPVKKKPPFAAIAGVVSAVVVVLGLGAALVGLLKGGDNLTVSE